MKYHEGCGSTYPPTSIKSEFLFKNLMKVFYKHSNKLKEKPLDYGNFSNVRMCGFIESFSESGEVERRHLWIFHTFCMMETDCEAIFLSVMSVLQNLIRDILGSWRALKKNYIILHGKVLKIIAREIDL